MHESDLKVVMASPLMQLGEATALARTMRTLLASMRALEADIARLAGSHPPTKVVAFEAECRAMLDYSHRVHAHIAALFPACHL